MTSTTFNIATLIFIACINTALLAVDYTAPTQKLAASADSLSLGTGLFSDNPTSIFHTDISKSSNLSVGAFHATLMEDYTYQTFAVAYSLYDIDWQLGYASSGTDDIDLTDTSGIDNEHVPIGTYGFSNTHIKLSGSKSLSNKLTLGAGFNYYNNSLYTTSGTGFNLSSSVKISQLFQNLDLAMSVNNILPTKMSYGDETEDLPLSFSVAGLYKVKPWLSVVPSMDFYGSKSDYERSFLSAFGIQWTPMPLMNLTASYAEHYAGLSVDSSFRVGVGITLHSIGFNYAYRTVDYSESPSQHFFSVYFKK